jgi:CBS domain-containing protein
VVGLANPEDDQVEVFDTLAKKAREGVSIPVRDIQTLAKKSPLVTLPESADLSKAIEHFGSGVHRILVCKDGTTDVVGILSQLKLVRFLWDNGTSFPAIDALYPVILKDLQIGTPQTIAIK